MVTSSWNLTVAGDRASTLAVVADYANAAEWTPAVRSASKLSPGPIGEGTTFQQNIDIAGGPADFVWKVKKLELPFSVELKGKAKIDIHQWWWPGRVKVKVVDRYYIQEGPHKEASLVEHYSHFHLIGVSKLLSPLLKPQWRDIKAAAREGLARLQGRPAEGELGAQQVPARGPAMPM